MTRPSLCHDRSARAITRPRRNAIPRVRHRGECRAAVTCITARSAASAVLIAILVTAGCSGSPDHPRAATRPVAPSSLVNPFMGTGVGGTAVGQINASPAAAVPLGMIQWGPDTAPERAPGGGYRAGATELTGLSLTHLSGPGCPAYGDVPILPTVGS